MEAVRKKKDVKYYCNKLKRAIVFTGWCRKCKYLSGLDEESKKIC